MNTPALEKKYIKNPDVETFHIIVIDDNPAIHQDFKKILNISESSELDDLSAQLFDNKLAKKSEDVLLPKFQIDTALQGQEGVEQIAAALKQDHHYAIAFVDIRMPPGWDGIETIKHIWALDKNIQVVICTAYTDYSWEETVLHLGKSENLFILKKPFDSISLRQLVTALTIKWLRRITETAENLTKEAIQSNLMKREFLANMSHELRSPLNGIIGFAELIYDGKAGEVSVEQKDYLGDIISSAHHLLQLINDILDLSRIESNKMEFHPEAVHLENLINETRSILATLITKKHLKLDVHVDSAVDKLVIDPTRLKQIIYNYLSNAIKFTPEGGKIEINAKPEGKDKFRLEVIDNGIGIRQEDIPKLFVEFQQLDTSTKKQYAGTGLGLALTRRIVEKQRGRVGVESALDKGSTFYAILPIKNKENQ